MPSEKSNAETTIYEFLKGGGEMSEIILTHDWSSSPIGQLPEWPVSLRTTLGAVLHSAFPMFLFWGNDLVCFRETFTISG